MAWTPPPQETIERALRVLEPWRLITSPVVLGAERIPQARPLLFVGNHTIYGIFDTPVLFAELYRRKGIYLRALGDHAHFAVPGWREFLLHFGVVDGTREQAGALLQEGACVLVFPGGGREVAKRRGEAYRLIWKERIGFARLAIRYGATIVPFGAVGGEEMFDIVRDAHDLEKTPARIIIDTFKVRPELLFPIARGVGPTPIPRPQRLYFEFCEPIPPPPVVDGAELDAAARALRDRARAAVEGALQRLLAERATDPLRRLPVRMADAALEAAGNGLQRLATRVLRPRR